MAYDIVKEKREAIEAGKEAIEYLEEALDKLNSARGWGMWDIVGGGFITSMIKHSKMRDARECIEDAKEAIDRFSDELDDIRGMNVNLDVGILATIFDFCDDDFLADLYVQSKINKSRDQITKAIREIKKVLEKISREY